ncbi:MAG TPA: Rieske 2Fe-2S domain-containing protein [Streptosporangiaceae bacterium]|jgi:phenylpropionate dioxygenase-like ring-hydroxylating dioxygenase large terminal subunit|nr:Rieske 2Fe-2S domain-containing protein [Streptosporangiaceae bacterium]
MVAAPELSSTNLVLDRPDTFQVHTRAYMDADVFAAEMGRIFGRTWVYVGHESQVPAVGDYRTTTIGRQPVIISRHEDDQIYVLLNRCRHRGSVVCREELGHSNFFRCPYHNWSYANDGALVGMAQASGYPGDFDKGEWGLRRAPRVAVYRGLIFASLAADGPSFGDYFAPVQKYVDWWLNRSPAGTITVLPTAHKYPYPGNWKWQAENGHDGYHGNYVHESWQRLLERAGEAPVRDIRKYRTGGCTRGFAFGHGLLERPGGLNPNASWTGRMMVRFPEYAEALRATYGDDEIEQISARRNIFVFPNLYLFDTQIRVINPIAVDSTEVHLYVYGLDGVPDALNQGRYRAHERFYGPSGFGSPDDVEIFVCNQTGLQASGVDWVLLSRGMHRERVGGDGEVVGHSTDEVPVRAMYREWERLMSA